MVTHHAKKLDGREVKGNIRLVIGVDTNHVVLPRLGCQPGATIGYMHVVIGIPPSYCAIPHAKRHAGHIDDLLVDFDGIDHCIRPIYRQKLLSRRARSRP